MVSGLWKERMTKPVVSSRSFPVILCIPWGCHWSWCEQNVEIYNEFTDY
jgi:hypothetical protein